MHRMGVGVAILCATLGYGVHASAQAEPTLRTLEHGDWASTVAALQLDLNAEGRLVHVVVEDATQRAPCGRYFLVLDAHGRLAFSSGACDPLTQATELRLVNRRALFEIGDVTSRPRIIQLVALDVRQIVAQGRATPRAGSELRCSVGLRPFLLDLFDGSRVRATPDRFEVRTSDELAEVEVSGDAWTVRAGSVRFEYELVDRRTGDVVLREAVALACSSEPRAPSVPRPDDRLPEESDLSEGPPFEGTLSAGAASRYVGRCGGEHAPERVFTLHIGEAIWLALRVESRFDAILSLRNAAGRELDCSVVSGDPGQVRVPRMWAQLAPGTYYVIVDGAGTDLDDGWYRLGMDYARMR